MRGRYIGFVDLSSYGDCLDRDSLNIVTQSMDSLVALVRTCDRVSEEVCRVLARKGRLIDASRCRYGVLNLFEVLVDVLIGGKASRCIDIDRVLVERIRSSVALMELRLSVAEILNLFPVLEVLKLFIDHPDLCRDVANAVHDIVEGRRFIDCGSLDTDSCIALIASYISIVRGEPPIYVPPPRFEKVLSRIPTAKTCVTMRDLVYGRPRVPKRIDIEKMYREIYSWYTKAIPLLKILAYTRKLDPRYLYASYRYITEYMPRPGEASIPDIATVAQEILSNILEWGSMGTNNFITMGAYALVIDQHVGKQSKQSKLYNKGLELLESVKQEEVEQFLKHIEKELRTNPDTFRNVFSIKMCGKANELLTEIQQLLQNLIIQQ